MPASSPDGAPIVVITPSGIYRPQTLRGALGNLARELTKAYRLVVIDFKAQSFGLYLGNLWLLIEPALQAAAYYFLLRVVFRVQGADSTFAFFFIGITFWRSHATLVTSGPYFLTGKGHAYIEQGLGLLPAILESVMSELLLMVARVLVLAAFLVAVGNAPSPMWALVILVVIAQFLFSTVLFLFLSVFGAAVKDIGKVVGHVVWIWWYMSPGLYSVGRIPEWAMFIYMANPFAYLIPSYHELFLKHQWSGTNIAGCFVVAAASVAVLAIAYRIVFRFSYRLAHHV